MIEYRGHIAKAFFSSKGYVSTELADLVREKFLPALEEVETLMNTSESNYRSNFAILLLCGILDDISKLVVFGRIQECPEYNFTKLRKDDNVLDQEAWEYFENLRSYVLQDKCLIHRLATLYRLRNEEICHTCRAYKGEKEKINRHMDDVKQFCRLFEKRLTGLLGDGQ